MHAFVELMQNLLSWLGYIGIFVMMTIESSFIPFPSEVAMIPAWYKASIWEMSLILAFLAWTLWAILWAVINYFIWYFFKEEKVNSLIKKYWKYVFLKKSHYDIAVNYFKKNWFITIFFARFIPAVRQIISLPAWVFKINLPKFLFLTWLWAWIWNIILIYIWYIWWENKELITKYSHIALWVTILIIIFFILSHYLVNKYFLKRYNNKSFK